MATRTSRLQRTTSRYGREETEKVLDDILRKNFSVVYIRGPGWSGVTTELRYIRDLLKENNVFDHYEDIKLNDISCEDSATIGHRFKKILTQKILKHNKDVKEDEDMVWTYPIETVLENTEKTFLVTIDDFHRLRDIDNHEEDIRNSFFDLLDKTNINFLIGSHAGLVIPNYKVVTIDLKLVSDTRIPLKFKHIIANLPGVLEIFNAQIKNGFVQNDQDIVEVFMQMPKSDLAKFFGNKDIMQGDKLDLRIQKWMKQFESILLNAGSIHEKLSKGGPINISDLLEDSQNKSRYVENLMSIIELHSTRFIQREEATVKFLNAYIEDALKNMYASDETEESEHDTSSNTGRVLKSEDADEKEESVIQHDTCQHAERVLEREDTDVNKESEIQYDTGGNTGGVSKLQDTDFQNVH